MSAKVAWLSIILFFVKIILLTRVEIPGVMHLPSLQQNASPVLRNWSWLNRVYTPTTWQV